MASLESSLLDSCTLGKLKKRAGTSDARLAASVPSFVPVAAVPFPSGPDYDRRRYHVHAAHGGLAWISIVRIGVGVDGTSTHQES